MAANHGSFFKYPLRQSNDSVEIVNMPTKNKKKKVDYEALNSALMRIPRMNVIVARNLIDLGINEIYQLQGRAPEVLFEESRHKNGEIPVEFIRYFRMAVYYAECDSPKTSKLHPDAWR